MSEMSCTVHAGCYTALQDLKGGTSWVSAYGTVVRYGTAQRSTRCSSRLGPFRTTAGRGNNSVHRRESIGDSRGSLLPAHRRLRTEVNVMKPPNRNWRARICILFLLCHAASWQHLRAQGEGEQHASDSLLTAARAIIEAADYCALITLDESGRPQVRTMDPFAPDDGMVVWFGTRRGSRKVEHIRRDPRVTVYYEAAGGAGYVSISGIAHLVEDPSEKAGRWKEGWEEFYEDPESDYLLIEVRPEVLEIIDYSRGIVGDRDTWRVPSVQFVSGPAGR